MPEISLARAAPGEMMSKLDPRTKLLVLLALNAPVMCTSPTSTFLAIQLLAVVALAREAGSRVTMRTGLGCLVCNVYSLRSPFLVAWLESVDSPRDLVLLTGTHSATAFRFVCFFVGLDLMLYAYRTTRIGQMKATLCAVHLPCVFVDALTIAFRVIPTVGSEAVAIREATGIRGIDLEVRGVLRHPLVITERFLVPLLPSTARVTDNLATPSVVRGFGGPARPTSLMRLRTTAWNASALACIAGVVAIEVDVYPGVFP